MSKLRAQEIDFQDRNLQYYGRLGLSVQLGSHQNRVGVFGAFHFGQPFLNAQLKFTSFYTFQDLGYYEKGWQYILTAGLKTGFQEGGNAYTNSIAHPFNHDDFYRLDFLYNFYLNPWNTQQRTAEIAIGIGHFILTHENDLFGKRAADKFRTAALQLGYTDSVQQISVDIILWTGNKDHPNTKRINQSEFSKYGYYDLSETPYGAYSHGILAIKYKRILPLGNQISMMLGYDDERIRNLVQNKFMHDLPFIPPSINKAQSRHIPMIDENGDPFLYKSDQRVRPGRWYGQLGLNDTSFY